MIRQPIVSVLGHIDHGKTTLLDSIRGSMVTAKEAGGITQHIGATEVPIDVVKKICGDMIKNMDVSIPGLLFIDTPGHEAFNNLRKRGGSIADIGVLVVDINEGFMPQTREALNILKMYKVPFIVVANKIDLLNGWRSEDTQSFMKSLNEQREEVKQDLDERLYKLVGILHKNGFESERVDRISDFKNQVTIIPISAKTGEGISEFLMAITGIAQKFMESKLDIKTEAPGKGTVLEVKQSIGLGTTIDLILYEGKISQGDKIVVGSCSGEPIVTSIKALLRPDPLEEMRTGQQFKSISEVSAASGIKISAPQLEDALPGAPVYVLEDEKNLENVKEYVKKEIGDIQFSTETSGVIVRADTLGTLEALVKMLTDENIKVRKARVGCVSKNDVVEAYAASVQNPMYGVIFAFHVKTHPAVDEEACNKGVLIFSGDVIYSLIEDYKEWVKLESQKSKDEILKKVTLPGKVKIIPGYVFRQSKPAVVGIEVVAGSVKPKEELINEKGEVVGVVKELQEENETKTEAKQGTRVAASINGATIGKNINEGDILYVRVPLRDIQIIKCKLSELVSEDELSLLSEIEKITK